uniref:Uncharacterized protein n=1 Tax=Osugoroshi virus TaxID=2202814 RepID=A0A7R7T2E7_9VIRU|nr:hypothetical protein [Osugoroshi virus]
MTDRAHARVYHGLRNLPPNTLPSDPLDRSRFFNSLHDAECSRPGQTTLVSPGFEAYLAAKAKEPAPIPHKKGISTTSSIQNSRNQAFLSMYGIKESDIVCNVKRDPYITSRQAQVLAFQYNPDRDNKILPAGDIDAAMYDLLTPISVKQKVPVEMVENFVYEGTICLQQFATALEVKNEFNLPSDVIETSIPTYISDTVDTDSGYDSPEENTNHLKCKISRPKAIRCRVYIKFWYTRRLGNKLVMRLGVKIRRVRHFGVGSHSLIGSRLLRCDIKYFGERRIRYED